MINSNKLNGCIKEVLVLADVLDSMAKKLNTELIVTSGYRDLGSNTAAGGSAYSYHLSGKAMDCSFKDRHVFKDVTELYYLVAKQEGAFKGICEFEVCRAKDGTQHFHFAFYNKPVTYFTGIYPKRS